MPAPNEDLIKLVINGTSGSGEIWQTGFYYRVGWVSDFPSQGDLDVVTAAIGPVVDTFWAAIRTRCSSARNLVDIRTYWYAPGSMSAGLVSQKPAVTPVAGNSATSHPLTVAAVASLRTSNPGRTGRGRMYLPTNGCALDSAGQYDSSACSTLANAVEALLENSQAAVEATAPTDGACPPVVVSYTSGVAREITKIIVDSIPDTQRRRDNKLVATVIQTRDIA